MKWRPKSVLVWKRRFAYVPVWLTDAWVFVWWDYYWLSRNKECRLSITVDEIALHDDAICPCRSCHESKRDRRKTFNFFKNQNTA